MAARRRILYFISSLEQGGAERQLAELIKGLDPARWEPLLAVCKPVDQLGYQLPSGPPRSIDSDQTLSPVAFHRFVALLRELRPDVVHTYMGTVNILGRLAARYAGIGRVVGSVRCTRLPLRDVVAEARTRQLRAALIVNSVGIRDELVTRAGLPSDEIDVIENGVDLARFRPLSEGERARARAEFSLGEGRALVVPGRVSSQKNHLALVRALAAMKKKGTLPEDVRVYFAGRGSPPWYGQMIRAAVARHGLRDRVRFLGIVGPIERLVGASDGVLLPSDYEGLPNAVVEAMACATPVVVSPPANTDHLVSAGREGLVTEGITPEAIEAALTRYLVLPPEARRAMGEAGRAHAVGRFEMARMVARTAAVYERVLGG